MKKRDIPRTVPHDGPEDPVTHALPEPPDYMCYRVAEPLVIDGRLDDASWQKATWLGPFVDMEKGTPTQYDTRVAFLWDDDAFYVGFRCEEPDVFGFETTRDGRVGAGGRWRRPSGGQPTPRQAGEREEGTRGEDPVASPPSGPPRRAPGKRVRRARPRPAPTGRRPAPHAPPGPGTAPIRAGSPFPARGSAPQ